MPCSVNRKPRGGGGGVSLIGVLVIAVRLQPCSSGLACHICCTQEETGIGLKWSKRPYVCKHTLTRCSGFLSSCHRFAGDRTIVPTPNNTKRACLRSGAVGEGRASASTAVRLGQPFHRLGACRRRLKFCTTFFNSAKCEIHRMRLTRQPEKVIYFLHHAWLSGSPPR